MPAGDWSQSLGLEPGALSWNMLYLLRIESDLKHCQVKVYLASGGTDRGYPKPSYPKDLKQSWWELEIV
jgi:hypothetical protein